MKLSWFHEYQADQLAIKQGFEKRDFIVVEAAISLRLEWCRESGLCRVSVLMGKGYQFQLKDDQRC